MTLPKRSRPLVLVVDDDPIMRMLAMDALDAAELDTAEALDGVEALAAFEDTWPDLVLLDVVMPRMNGFEACRELRRRNGGADTPILMMTGLEDLDAIDRAYEAGATDFVTKPINYKILGRRLHYMLRARRTLEDLRRSEQWLANAQRVAKLGYWEWHEGSADIEITPSAAHLLGLERKLQSLHIDALLALVHSEDRLGLQTSLRSAAQRRARIESEVRVQVGDELKNVSIESEPSFDESSRSWRHLGAFQDVTERRRSEARVRELASFDIVTGLPNRRTFVELVRRSLNEDPGRGCALVCARISNLTELGHSYGPATMDELARALARRLSHVPPDLIHLGRLGPDLYGAFVGPADDAGRIQGVTRAIVGTLSEPVSIDGDELWPSIHLGIVRVDDQAYDADTVVKNATTAASLPPERPGQQHLYYAPALDDHVRERLTLEAAMRHEIGGDQFALVYQPKVDLASGRTRSAEALLRWSSPELGIVMPNRFIPIAESSGLIVPLSDWAFRAACEQAVRWSRELAHPVSIAVNASAKHFMHPKFVRVLRGVLEETGLPAELLQIELTESALMSDIDFCVGRLTELRDLGLSVALDDFGTGYSSLAYLHQFPIDTLKIDRSFVARIFSSNDGGPIVSTIMALARTLNLEVVAEGVETQNEVDFLAELGCDLIQGYFFSKPLLPDAFAAWHAQRNRSGKDRSAHAESG